MNKICRSSRSKLYGVDKRP